VIYEIENEARVKMMKLSWGKYLR